ALQHSLPERQRRSKVVQDAVARRFPSIPKPVCVRAAHLLRTVVSSRNWFVLRIEEQLSAAETIETAGMCVRLIFAELERYEAAAQLAAGTRKTTRARKTTAATSRRSK